ncbi:MAG: universal stress protein [bacterium]|nr:universal stress protein [bacterium]MDT8366246.1 universal stress protein [bacterium]
MYKNILIPTDGVRTCESAIFHGIELAKAIGAKVTALHSTPKLTPHEILEIYHPQFLVGGSDAEKAQHAMDHVEELHKDVADKSLAAIDKIAGEMGVPCEVVYVTGKAPAEGILETSKAKSCDLIYLATHGSMGLTGAIFGTVATKVLSQSKIPVLIQRCEH